MAWIIVGERIEYSVGPVRLATSREYGPVAIQGGRRGGIRRPEATAVATRDEDSHSVPTPSATREAIS